jgi:hypothetical protein
MVLFRECPRRRMLSPMNKRNVATVLWFVTGWTGGALLFGLLDAPAALALVPAITIAMLVHLDPAGWFWPAKVGERRIRPIEELAAELDRNHQGAGVAVEQRSSR